MSEPEINFRHEFVGGALTVQPPTGDILMRVYNRGSSDHYVRALVQRGTGAVVFDSFLDPSETSPGIVVHSHKLWTWPVELGDELGTYVVRILTTSLDLVPSIEFRVLDDSGDLPKLVTYAYEWPGDFALFELPFHLPPVGPGQGGTVGRG